MSAADIVIVQGPHPARRGLSGEALAGLRGIARAAGSILRVRSCASLRELIASLRSVRARGDFVLLDPGELADPMRSDATLREALESMRTPYVEVHERCADVLELPLRAQAMPLATIVIHGDLGASYRIGLGIALRRLGRHAAHTLPLTRE
ncbi:hypothetical protein JI752_017960 [Lysobacter sp. MMG2]|uniref:hypothetical protein n=1 Tax=Lysobacter sp. MMG2 TaxID=2801338 RepID=UPI001C250719|nr:hypothetical protein [Lysobacter sp. MMG2]MBU8978038.1 hypothetical protein [Lysobacter sp. MMG2]